MSYDASYPAQGLLGKLMSANFNTTADQAIPIEIQPAQKYRISDIYVMNASRSFTIAAGGIYTAPNKGGTAIVGSLQIYTGLTGSLRLLPLTINILGVTDIRTEAMIYLSLTLAQGAAATADIYIFGQRFPTP